jgi:hypothetical protein
MVITSSMTTVRVMKVMTTFNYEMSRWGGQFGG